MTYATILLLAIAQPAVPGPPQVPALPQGPPVVTLPQAPPVVVEQTPRVDDTIKPVEPTHDDRIYTEASRMALDKRKPLVILVGVPLRAITGTIACRLESFEGDATPRLIVAVVEGGKLHRIGTLDGEWSLPATATDAQINAAVFRSNRPIAEPPLQTGGSQGRPLPFRPGEATADVKSKVTGPWLDDAEHARIRKLWPKELAFPVGLRFYKRSTWGQNIGHNGSIGRDEISPWHNDQDAPFQNRSPALNPNRHIAHWRTPGGLDSISGWRSYVGVRLPGPIIFWEGQVAVGNAPGGALHKKLWRFPKDTLFVDFLCNDSDKPVEVRMRERTDDGWESDVVYKSADNRIAGYVSARHNTGKRCADCHEKADHGDGAQYHLVLRGGDGVRSFPVMREGTLTPDQALPIDHR